MADSNLATLAYIAETVEGTTPSTPELTQLRFTGEGVNYNVQNTTSKEIRSDRQVTDLVQTGANVTGPVNFEFSADEYDPFLKAGLLSAAWSTPLNFDAGGTGIGIAFSAGSAVITDLDTGGTLTANLAVGQFVRLTGFANAVNNSYFRVTAIGSANAFTVDAAGVTMIDETENTDANISASWIKTGTTRQAFTIEKGFNDAGGAGTDEYFQFAGMLINSLNLSLSAQSILTGSFDLFGRSATGPVSASIDNSGGYTAPQTGAVLNAGSNVANLFKDGAAIASGANSNYVQSLTIAVGNNLREQYAVGSLSVVGMGVGKADVTGNMTTYFATEAIMADYIAGTEFSLSFVVQTGAGAAATQYLFDMPRCKFESGEVVAGGQDSDVLASMRYRALRYTTNGDFTFAINKFAAT